MKIREKKERVDSRVGLATSANGINISWDGVNTKVAKHGASGYHSFQAVSS